MPNNIMRITFHEAVPIDGWVGFVYNGQTILETFKIVRTGPGTVTRHPEIIKTIVNYSSALNLDRPSIFKTSFSGNVLTVQSINSAFGFKGGFSSHDVTFSYSSTVVGIDTNRARQCKNSLGGIRAAFLAPYRKIYRSEIIYDRVTLFEFPETYVYKFDLPPGNVFEQRQSENEGGKYFDVNLSLTFNKITPFDNMNFQKLLKKDYFLIVEDNNGNFFLLGFRNGVTAEAIKTSTTQYTIDFTGMEEEFAPFVTDLMGEDFIIVDGENYIFQDDTNYIFNDDTNYIFQ